MERDENNGTMLEQNRHDVLAIPEGTTKFKVADDAGDLPLYWSLPAEHLGDMVSVYMQFGTWFHLFTGLDS